MTRAGTKQSRSGALAASVNPAAVVGASARESRRPADICKGGVKLEDLTGDALKEYARSVGIKASVIADMGEDKLKRECLLKVHEFLDQLDD